ncbi:MAG: serine O-acetyltransferase [Ruegeria sp.]|nr:serine O-acetyltransferase [Ruegeria sp.]
MSETHPSRTRAGEFWVTLRHEIEEITGKEPMLAEYLSGLLSAQTDLRQALAQRLARGLANSDVPEGRITVMLMEGLHAQPDIVEATARDLIVIRSNDPASRTYAHAFLNYKGFHAVQVSRIAHAFWRAGRIDLAAWLSNRASFAFGPDIHPAAKLGKGIMLDHGSGIVIGETAVVEDNVTILQNVTLGGTGKIRGDRHPKVRKGVMIGAGANIIGNIELGAFSKVAAGSVVIKDVPAHSTVAGIPAQIVRLHNLREAVAATKSRCSPPTQLMTANPEISSCGPDPILTTNT